VEAAAKKYLQAAIADPERFCESAIEIGRIGEPKLALILLSELLKTMKAATLQSAIWCAIGNVYSNAGARIDAMECFTKSWDINPHPGSASNRALIHLWNGEVRDAERWIKRSLEMNPWLPEVQFVQSMITLVGRGHYPHGFKQYECRWRSKGTGLRKLPCPKPEWPGPSAKKGILLVYGEQGMGDTILVLRYAKLIKELGLKQVWVTQPPIKALAESMGIIDKLRDVGEYYHDYHFHIPAISLIRAFGTSVETIPPTPYLPFPDRTMDRSAFRVGICWKGSSVNRNNEIRSAPLEWWKPVLDLPGIEFHSLQVDGWEEALAYPQIKISSLPKDWMDTAKQVAQMDLVISVDTALVHLCGAMDSPCWVPLHCRPYFVYPLTRGQCPWYPSLRLFKQKKEHEWGDVFQQIASELKKL
jgi:tetratricopeptide (TPR) repeat protein